METLDVVRAHERALTTMSSSGGLSGSLKETIRRANAFFSETIAPIENTHRAALRNGRRENRLTGALRRRTREASVADRQLKRGIAQRQAAEAAVKKSATHRAKHRVEARGLKTQLRNLTREFLSAQEDERRMTSRHLRNEVAQSLLAINVRLLTLNKAAKVNSRQLKKDIAETQRLVRQSARAIHRLSTEPEGSHET
jgi:signal transduction histidine kinase